MDELFYLTYLKEEIEDLNKALTYTGVEGVLRGFEFWLSTKGYLIKDYSAKQGKEGGGNSLLRG
jgi:hypothetical protein